MELWLEPFSFPFMQYAFVITALVALPAALLSCFMVLKGWSLMGDAISHAVFPGVVLAYMAGLPLGVGAFIAGLFSAIATGYLQENSRIKQDTVMGIVFSGMFGVGLLLYVKIQSDVHLEHILFGDMLGVSDADLIETGWIALLTTGIILLKWRDFLLHAFDPVQARTSGLHTSLLHYGLLAMISLTIVGALKAVGIILSIAILIAPGAIAFLLTRKFSTMMVLAVLISEVSGFLGIYLSFFIDSSPAPTIVLIMSGFFIAAFAYASIKARRVETAPIV